MNRKTRKAIKGSIWKWRRIVWHIGMDNGTLNCPLCRMFYNVGYCEKCPVSIEVRKSACANTPYTDYKFEVLHGSKKDQHKCAKEELKFLKSLLKEK